MLLFWDRISLAAQVCLKLMFLLPQSLSAGNTGVCHHTWLKLTVIWQHGFLFFSVISEENLRIIRKILKAYSECSSIPVEWVRCFLEWLSTHPALWLSFVSAKVLIPWSISPTPKCSSEERTLGALQWPRWRRHSGPNEDWDRDWQHTAAAEGHAPSPCTAHSPYLACPGPWGPAGSLTSNRTILHTVPVPISLPEALLEPPAHFSFCLCPILLCVFEWYIIIVHNYGVKDEVWFIYTLCRDQIRVISIFIMLNTYHRECGMITQWNTIQPCKRMKSCHRGHMGEPAGCHVKWSKAGTERQTHTCFFLFFSKVKSWEVP